MNTTRRTLTVLVATLLAALTGATPALAQPAPLIEPGRSTGTGTTTTTSSGGGMDTWLQVSIAILVALAVVAVIVALASRTRNRVPRTA